MTDEEKLAFIQTVAERILFSHASDIEYLTICEMTSDDVQYGTEEIQRTYEDDADFDALLEAVDKKVSDVLVGFSWDGGSTWQY